MLLLAHFTKKCSCCQEIKNVTLFHKDKKSKDGISYHCKVCSNNRHKKWKEENREKAKESSRRWKNENKEKVSELGKKSYLRNKENKKEYYKKYSAENKDKIRIKNQEYKKNNIEKVREAARKYYHTDHGKVVNLNKLHKRRNAFKDSDISNEAMKSILAKAKFCYWCKCPLKNVKVHVDHYVPIKLEGLHMLDNIVVTCSHCNHLKSSKDPLKFANSLGRLL